MRRAPPWHKIGWKPRALKWKVTTAVKIPRQSRAQNPQNLTKKTLDKISNPRYTECVKRKVKVITL